MRYESQWPPARGRARQASFFATSAAVRSAGAAPGQSSWSWTSIAAVPGFSQLAICNNCHNSRVAAEEMVKDRDVTCATEYEAKAILFFGDAFGQSH
jgi:hypothetical protein